MVLAECTCNNCVNRICFAFDSALVLTSLSFFLRDSLRPSVTFSIFMPCPRVGSPTHLPSLPLPHTHVHAWPHIHASFLGSACRRSLWAQCRFGPCAPVWRPRWPRGLACITRCPRCPCRPLPPISRPCPQTTLISLIMCPQTTPTPFPLTFSSPSTDILCVRLVCMCSLLLPFVFVLSQYFTALI